MPAVFFRSALPPATRAPWVVLLAVAVSAYAVPAARAADTTAPAAVRGMVVSTDTSRVKLDWSSNGESDLAGYLVYRAGTADGPFTRLTGTPRTSSDYYDTAAPAGFPSYYRVSAVDRSGNESAPVAVTGTRKDGVRPAAPTAASVAGAGSSYTVDWADNAEADLAGYVVSRASSPGGTYTRLTPTPLSTSTFTDTGVPAGTTPYYRITSVDFSGHSSAATVVTLPDRSAPAAVRGMSVNADTSRVKLDWSSNSESDLRGYLVHRSPSAEGPFTRLTSTPISSSEYADTRAPVGVVAYYQVTAVDRSGNESAPVLVSGTRKDGVRPATPSGITVAPATGGFTLDWADNADADLAGYVVSRATSSGGTYTMLTTSPVPASSFTDTAAPAGRTVYYRIAAVDASGNRSSTAGVTATPVDTTAPAAVRSMSVSADSSRVKLDWSSNGESDLAGYLVHRSASAEGPFTRLTTAPVTSSEYADTTSTPGVTSYYRVVAVDRSGNESAPVAASGTRRDTLAPAAPAALTATAADQGITLDWADGTEPDLAGYVVSRAASSGGSYTRLSATPVPSSTFADTTAPVGVTSYYRVTAVDASGNTSAATATSATRTDTTAPAAPTGLVATGTSAGISLTWDPNTETDLAGYLLLRSDSAEGPFTALTAAPVSGTTYLDATAPGDRHSSYRLVAVDRSGNRSEPTVVEGVPADTTPPAEPTALLATGSDTDVSLDWADNTEADLGGYLVYRSGTAGGSFLPLTATPVSASSYVDTTAPVGVQVFYRVVAVDTTTNASRAAEASATRTAAYAPIASADATVASDGSGDHTTVAAALAAAPAGTTPWAIGIKPGTYREVLSVTRANVTLFGATGNAADVVITYDNASGTPKPDGSGTYGTTGSATVLVKGNDVTVRGLTIENAYRETGTGSEQAVALKTTGDRLVFDTVRLLGDQDTLYVDTPQAGTAARAYFTNSYVEGDVDFIFGRGTAVFDRSTIKAATRGSASNNGYVTAASTNTATRYGFLITDSTIVSDAPDGTFALGRPWQPGGDANAIAQVIVRDTVLPAAIRSSAWVDMTSTFSWRDARFAEYRNTGPGAVVNGDRPQLTDAQAATHTRWSYLAGTDGWNPTGQVEPDGVAPAAPTALTATAGDGRVDLSWAANAETDVAGYHLYRVADGEVTATPAHRVTAGLLTSTGHADRAVTNGTTYRYLLTAVDRAGNESAASAVVTGSPVAVALPAHDILVAQDGTGDHTTVQAALDAAPAGTAGDPTVIAVTSGTYREMLRLAKNHVTLIGATGDPRDVVLTYDNAAGTPLPSGTGTYGTGNSQSVLVSGSNVTVRDLSIENAFDEAAFTYAGEQAVALKTTGDRLVFDGVRILGNQDTLLVDSPDAPVVARSYFVDSYIQGDVDFIFGRGTAVFDRTTIHALTRGSSSNNGYVTAASTSDRNPFGILITDSTITSNAPAGTFSLGRPWRGWSDGYTKNGVVHNSRGQVVVRDTALPAAIRTGQPWADMSPNLWTDGRFAEYSNSGAGATTNANRPQLSDGDAARFTRWTYLAGADGWNPTGRPAPVAPDTTAPAAPTAPAATAGDGRAVLSWTAPADQDVEGYHVYRSATGTATATGTPVNGSTPVTGTSFADTGLTNGTTYSYVVTAVDAAGNESAASASASATPAVGDSTAPAVPAGVSTRLGKSTVTVSWTAVPDADVAGYVVHRSTGGGTPTRVSGSGPVTGTSFTDSTGIVGTAYRYTVTAVDTAGNESAASAVASATPVRADVVVAADGSGDATTVQGGINLLADNANYTTQGGRIVLIQPGTYTGAVSTGNRYGVTLVGGTSDAADTVLTAPGGAVATFTVSGHNWAVRDLTLASVAASAGSQATAVQVRSGDQQVFDNVRFLGDAKTLLLSTANVSTYSRVHIRDSYVEGGADMVLGRAVTVIENSTIRVLNRPGAALTDSSVGAAHPYGILITGSRIETDGAAGSVYLGRPYPEAAGTSAQVVVRETALGAGIRTAGPWKDWNTTTPWTTGRFFEYRNTGPGAAVVDPATRPQLTDADAATYTAQAYLAGNDGWKPAQ